MVESRLRPPRFLPESFAWGDGGRGSANASEEEKQLVVAGVYVPADEGSVVAGLEPAKVARDTKPPWDEGIELRDQGIRKTVRIDQSY